MSWLLVTWFLAFGWVPVQDEYVGNNSLSIKSDNIVTVAEVGIEAKAFDRFILSVNVENFQGVIMDDWAGGGLFSPYRIDYKFGLGFIINEYISIEATHGCDHMISRRLTDGYESSETKVIAKIQGVSSW